MSSNTTNQASILSLLLTLVVTACPVGYGIWWLKNYCINDGIFLNCNDSYISFGEKVLITLPPKDINKPLDKEKGAVKLRNGNFGEAKLDFQNAWLEAKSRKEDEPEALIYFNNASYASKDSIQIIVSVPISQNLNIAKEILRGVAQAQSEVNQQGGIHKKFLRVGIADDINDEKTAREVANEAVNKRNIVAVVGHNASRVSKKVAEIYDRGKLVMVTPTSYALDLSNNSSPYIFKIVPDVNFFADKLSDYYSQTHKKNLLICYDKEDVSRKFKDFFKARNNSQVTYHEQECNLSDLSVGNFHPESVINQAKENNADSFLLATSVQKIDLFTQLAKVNNGQLALFGSPTLHTDELLRQAKKSVKGMVLVTPWHPDAFPGNPFLKKAQNLWSEPVNWRTAVAYDATKAIIEGLKQSKNITREELQHQLYKIQLCGATGNISFNEAGERKETQVFIVRVDKDRKSDTGYNFVLDPLVKDNLGISCHNSQ